MHVHAAPCAPMRLSVVPYFRASECLLVETMGAHPVHWVLLFSIDRQLNCINKHYALLLRFILICLGGGAAPSPDPTPKFVTECCIMIKLKDDYFLTFKAYRDNE